jgi:hypothetical protein
MSEIITIERINIDKKGKKVVFYKSKIKSLAFNFEREMIPLQIDKSDEQMRPSILM